jgi:hypothetical protein
MTKEQYMEVGLKDALKTATDELSNIDERPVYRAFWVDDETDEDRENLKYPFVMIKVKPRVPQGHQSIFSDAETMIKVATHRKNDEKREVLERIYEKVRGVIDDDDWGIDIEAAITKKSTIIEDTDADVEGDENYAELTLNILTCG